MDYRTPNIYDPSTLTEPYAYARANPAMFWDPNGLKEIPYRIGNTNYILHIDDETWSAILHGELTFAGVTLFDPLAPVTPNWVIQDSWNLDSTSIEMTNEEEVKRYKRELQSREAKQLAFIQKFMPRHTNTVFPWILNDVLKSLNESDAQGRGAIYRALYQAGMLHQVNVANGFGQDYAQEAALALVGPQIAHYKKFGFWQDFEVASWLFSAGEAGWILKDLIRPSRSLLARSFDDLLPVAPKHGVQTNKAAGDALRDLIARREAPALVEQSLKTVGGIRRVDVLKLGDELVAIESKVGKTALTARVRQELARDWWLRRQGQVQRVVWEFSRSDVTGEIGATKSLLEKLEKLGIDVIINN